MLASLLKPADDCVTPLESVDFKVEVQALNNQNRIDELRSRIRLVQSFSIKTTFVSRVLRKDWNILTVKMFILEIQRKAEESHAALAELVWQANDLATGSDLAQFRQTDTSWLAPINFTVTMVSPSGSTLLRALQSIDNSVAILFGAQRDGLIDKLQRRRILAGVSMALNEIKSQVTKI